MPTWTTTIHFAAIRTAGTVHTNLDITNAGTPGAQAHATIGSVLARVSDLLTAQRLAAIWRDAAIHTHRLVPDAGFAGHGDPRTQCPAGLVVRIGPDAAVRQDLIPATATLPTHIRIQVGPIVWLIMDRAAYSRTRELWERLEDLLA
ncbi:hypothetical protein [Amycolatopsis sp. H20-H5]|uniref:hypothetical protein n=1 Tax=Amycolatopsis sp. H20-H5 TaxID=3046309 RepID=UPI002DBE515C|nr:hypothetical protein [Amycolatopsis sp. H20-H5]MEC3977158.1 hypothetical protein [Amycolatopsis sp. H20-H5]